MRKPLALLLATCAALAGPASAQLGLPPLGGVVGDVIGQVDRTLDPVERTVDGVTATIGRLAQARIDRLNSLLRRNRDAIERDASGELARKGEVLLLDPDATQVATAERAGFVFSGREELGELAISVVRLRVPEQMTLARAQRELEKILPGVTVSADNLHEPSDSGITTVNVAGAAGPSASIDTQVGIIDGAPGPLTHVGAVRGFAEGAPRPSNHGSAIASLLASAGVRRIAAADVYGADPAGGNALAISRGIDWLIGLKVRVISISLTGPSNAVLRRSIAAAQRRGVIFVAAVGNDGPAAPPSYPASYPGVIAVTGVDGRNRALVEAGRALHLDYAAPGADIFAANAKGKRQKLRGTSYAVPLVAARAGAVLSESQDVIEALDREAMDLGMKGPDRTYGRGLLCGDCRPTR